MTWRTVSKGHPHPHTLEGSTNSRPVACKVACQGYGFLGESTRPMEPAQFSHKLKVQLLICFQQAITVLKWNQNVKVQRPVYMNSSRHIFHSLYRSTLIFDYEANASLQHVSTLCLSLKRSFVLSKGGATWVSLCCPSSANIVPEIYSSSAN